MHSKAKPLITICVFCMLPATGWAYVGPGAGLGMIGSLLAIIGTVALALAGLVLLPVRLFIKARKTGNAEQDRPTENSPSLSE